MGRTLQGYKKLFDGLKKGTPRRFYLLYGPEEYIKKEYVAELIKTALPEGNRAFNLDVIHGDEFDAELFRDRIGSFPLFQEQRMIIIKRFHSLSTGNKNFVFELLADAPDTVVVVLETEAEKLDTARMKSLKKLADEKGICFNFKYLSDEETLDRIKSRLHREGLGIEPEAVDLLIDSVGTRLIELVNELDKIVLSASGEKVVTKDLVSAVVGKYRTEEPYAFIDQLGMGDTKGLIRRMEKVVNSGKSPVFVVEMLLRRIAALVEVKTLMDESNLRAPQAIASRMSNPANPWYVGRLVEQARRFDEGELQYYLENLRWADVKLKSTSVHPQSVLETAVVASALRKRLALDAN
jgi:DNA polymerase-3 subunit delta